MDCSGSSTSPQPFSLSSTSLRDEQNCSCCRERLAADSLEYHLAARRRNEVSRGKIARLETILKALRYSGREHATGDHDFAEENTAKSCGDLTSRKRHAVHALRRQNQESDDLRRQDPFSTLKSQSKSTTVIIVSHQTHILVERFPQKTVSLVVLLQHTSTKAMLAVRCYALPR